MKGGAGAEVSPPVVKLLAAAGGDESFIVSDVRVASSVTVSRSSHRGIHYERKEARIMRLINKAPLIPRSRIPSQREGLFLSS